MTDNADAHHPRRPPAAPPTWGREQTATAARTTKIVAVCMLVYMCLVVGNFAYDHLL